MSFPKSVRIVEVGPRDGLQNETQIVSIDDKVQFIKKLSETGLKTIEVTSFVRPDKIPQMQDASELFEKVKKEIDIKKFHLPCLVPNLTGLEKAKNADVNEIAVFTATSDTFNQKNINATVDESFDRIEPVMKEALKHNMKIRAYVSTVFGCPYEGKTSVEKLKKVCDRLLQNGAYEISLGDTIGVANPLQVKEILSELKKNFDFSKISMHFHDTRGLATSNILSSLEEGMESYDSSAGGLGGCPYAKGSTGNVATEDVVYLCESMGIQTGIDLDKLVDASEFILKKLGKTSPSKYHQAHMSARN